MAVRKGTFEETDEIARCYSMGYPAETLKKRFDCDSVRWLVRRLAKNFGEEFVLRLKQKRATARTRYYRYCKYVREVDFDDFVELEECFTAQTARQLILQVQAEQLYNEMERLYWSDRLTETERQESINLLKMKIIRVEKEIEKEAKKAWRKSKKKAV